MKCKCGCGEDCRNQYVHGHNMRWKTVSKESRVKISESHKGKKYSKESKLKMSNTRKRLIEEGKLFSKETREKMRNSRLGKHLSEEAKEKLRTLVISKETREKISKAGMGRFYSEETRKKLSLIHKGRKFSEEHKRKLKIHRSKMILPSKDTLIELKIQNFLKQLGIDFFTHQHIKKIEHGYQCDILIPSMNLVIECDGDYWHEYPVGREIDHIRTKELIKQGFKVLRLWERDIRVMELKDFESKIKKIN